MTSNSEPQQSHPKLPTIHLEKTLADLYREHCPSLSTKRIGHIFCGTTCAGDLSPDFPRNRKYFYQDSAFNDSKRSSKTDAEVQRLLAPKYLSLVPQRDAFIAGDAPVIFFYSGRDKGEVAHDERETSRTLEALGEKQKPEVLFSTGPSSMGKLMQERGINHLTSKLLVDAVVETAREKMLVDPDTLWHLNSKEALARSGLPTPKAEIIAVEGHCPAPETCCEACVTASRAGEIHVPDACTGPRKRWIGEQSLRILSRIESHPLPFVFKNQQTFGGAGTYVLTSGPDRNNLLAEMTSGGILQRMLSHVTAENAHLRPGNVLLTDMIEGAVADYGITFFVSESGEAKFLAASEQMIDPESTSWIGSTINYEHQTSLRQKFEPMVQRIGVWLHQQGYLGPAGVDILETERGDLQIVDLNVRTSGSLSLPLLRTHFVERGFQCASSVSITVKQSRDEFLGQWRDEVEKGQLCVLAWYEDFNVGKSFGDVVVGGVDDGDLAKMLEKVRGVSEQVTF